MILLYTDRGVPYKKAGKSQKPQLVLRKGNMCTWRPKVLVFDWNGYGVPYEKGWKITKKVTCVFEGEHVFMKRRSRCWCLELYHAFVADVLGCITFPLLMSWAVSRFYCWCLELYDTFVFCLELYHASVAHVLSSIALLLLMSWAASRFCCWCLELYRAFVADVLSCVTLRQRSLQYYLQLLVFPLFLEIKNSFWV